MMFDCECLVCGHQFVRGDEERPSWCEDCGAKHIAVDEIEDDPYAVGDAMAEDEAMEESSFQRSRRWS